VFASILKLIDLFVRDFIETWYRTSVSSDPSFVDDVKTILDVVVRHLAIRSDRTELRAVTSVSCVDHSIVALSSLDYVKSTGVTFLRLNLSIVSPITFVCIAKLNNACIRRNRPIFVRVSSIWKSKTNNKAFAVTMFVSIERRKQVGVDDMSEHVDMTSFSFSS
jgi:hypothetical protein